MRTCPTCSERNADSARFCQACGSPLPEAPGPTADVRKTVTIVFADMAGSTGLGERLDPEALRRVQARYFDALTGAVEAHGGTVEKYIGDAVMAVFGIPQLHEDDALRAVRAAVAMQEAVETLNVSLDRDLGVRIAVRIGINTGEVVAGDPSGGQRLVTGDAVNVAARLEQTAEPGEVLIAAATQQLVRDAVEVDDVRALEIRGKGAPVAAYRLRGVLAGQTGHLRNLDSPLVGRARELDLLRRGLDRAREERTSALFTLLGSAGVGKSRLIREFLASVDDATVLRGRCLSYGDGITYYAMAEVVRSAVGVAETDDPQAAMARLSATLEDAEDGDRVARLVGGMFGWAETSAAEDASWAMRKLLEHLARDRPVVLVIDDIHWAEPLMLDLLEYLADWTRDAMVLVVCIARPELLEVRPGWGGGKVNATTVLLEPLPVQDAGTLLENLLGGANLPAAAHDRILAAAEGNPLFVEEMLGMLIDDGLLRQEDGRWRAVADLADLTVPPTIQLLLAARLDRLEAEERAIIERGAVEGKVFHSGAIASLTAEGLRPQIRPRLLALARKELIRPDRAEFAGEDAFRFRHMLIRDAAYQAMAKEQRAELHERFARWLTATTNERIAEYGEIFGYHLEQAHRYRTELGLADERTHELGREAGRALRASAHRVQPRGDYLATARLFERAMALLDGFERAEATVELAQHLSWSNEDARSLPILRPFLASPEATKWPGLRIRAEMFVTFAEALTDPTRSQEASVREVRRLLAEAEGLGDEVAIIACLLGVGQWAFWTGRTSEQRRISERLLPRLDSLPTIYRTWLGVGLGGDVLFGMTPVETGLAGLPTNRRVAGDSVMGGIGVDTLEFSLLTMADRPDDADAVLQRISQRVTDLPTGTHPGVGQNVAVGLWRLGRREGAIEALRADKAGWDARGETGVNSTSTARLALYLARTGNASESRALVADARRLGAADDFATLVYIGFATAAIALEAGDVDAALDAIEPAIVRLRETDYLVDLADGIRLRGEVLAAADRTAEAAAAFAEAMALYEAKGDLADARDLREWQTEHALTV